MHTPYNLANMFYHVFVNVQGLMKRALVKRKSRLAEGKGYSLGELEQAGITAEQARGLGIAVDRRRRSVHPENVEELRVLLGERKS